MTAHVCRAFDPGCYRCDLGRDEEIAALAEDYWDTHLYRDLAMTGLTDEALNWLRLRYVSDLRKNPVAVEELYVWHSRREWADVDTFADHAWNVRDVFISNA